MVTGVLLSKKQSGTDDYFLASRKMPAWAVAISVLATATSAATFIGGPQQAYAGDLTYLSATLGSILAACLVAYFLLPLFYRHAVTTVYELLEYRFGPSAQTAGTLMFMLGRLMASGARIFIAAHALAFVVTGTIEPSAIAWSVVALVIVGVLYTVWGGIATVIWTDVVQTVVFIGAVAVAFVVLLLAVNDQTGSLSNTLDAISLKDADGQSKSTILSFSLDPAKDFTLWTALIGFTLFNAAAYGTDQDLAQRLLTCRSSSRAARSMMTAALLGLPVTALFMTIGLLLHVYAPTSPSQFDSGTGVKPFLQFITQGVPPGVGGLLVAGVFAAGLSSLDSALNALSSTFVTDIYRKFAPSTPPEKELRVARIGVVAWGVLLGAFALGCVFIRSESESSSTLLTFALSVMTYPYSGLLAVFIVAALTNRGSTASVIAALIVGPIVVFSIEHIINDPIDGPMIAFPWRLTVGVIASFFVCVAAPGNRPHKNPN